MTGFWHPLGGGTGTPSTGTAGLLGVVSYNPATLTNHRSTSTSWSALDTTNLRASFTGPVSGLVMVRLTAAAWAESTGYSAWCLLNAGSVVVGSDARISYSHNGYRRQTHTCHVTAGAGVLHTWDWGQRSETGPAVNTRYGGLQGGAVMEVWAA